MGKILGSYEDRYVEERKGRSARIIYPSQRPVSHYEGGKSNTKICRCNEVPSLGQRCNKFPTSVAAMCLRVAYGSFAYRWYSDNLVILYVGLHQPCSNLMWKLRTSLRHLIWGTFLLTIGFEASIIMFETYQTSRNTPTTVHYCTLHCIMHEQPCISNPMWKLRTSLDRHLILGIFLLTARIEMSVIIFETYQTQRRADLR